MAKSEFVANKALADELEKRFKLIEKAKEQIMVGNYGIAKKLLCKVLYDELKISIVNIK